jgi:hypothetical protein
VLPTFSTFYQKYVNNKNIWQCYNYQGFELLYTEYEGDGYAITAAQVDLLTELLAKKKIDVSPAMALFHTQTNYGALQLR